MLSQDDIAHQQNLLRINRARLKVLLEQETTMGTFTPAYVRLEIDSARSQIRNIKSLLRGWKVPVEDAPGDDPSMLSPATSASNEQVAHRQGDSKTEETLDLTNEGADFVIVTALEEERDAVLDKLPGFHRHAPSDLDIRVYYSANLPTTFADDSAGSYRVAVLTLLGMGRVQAAAALGDAIRRWRPRYVLLVGIAGGVAERGVKIGDILISDQIVDYELQKITPEGPQVRWEVHRANPQLLAAASDFPYSTWKRLITVKRPGTGTPMRHIGPIASGDKVLAFDEAMRRYRDTWPNLIGVEMEAGGATTAAFQAAKPPGFFMVRGVSDLGDTQKNSASVKKWRAYACEVAAAYTVALLKSGPVPLNDRL